MDMRFVGAISGHDLVHSMAGSVTSLDKRALVPQDGLYGFVSTLEKGVAALFRTVEIADSPQDVDDDGAPDQRLLRVVQWISQRQELNRPSATTATSVRKALVVADP